MDIGEKTYINAGGEQSQEGAVVTKRIVVYPMFGERYEVPVEEAPGGHGGGDPRLLEDIFGNPQPDPFNRAASHVDGAMSILVGVAGNKSIATGMPVKIADMVKF